MKKDIRTHEAKIDLVKKFLDYANIADASYAMLEAIKGSFKDIVNGREKEVNGDKQDLGSTYTDKNTNIDYVSTYARAIEARFNQDSKNSQGKKIDNKIQNVSKEIDSTQYKDSNGCHIFNTENNIPQKLLYVLYSILGILVIVSFNGCSFSFKSIDPQYYKYKNLVQSNSFVLYDKQLKAIGDLYYNTKIAVTLEMNKDGSIEKATFQEYLSRN